MSSACESPRRRSGMCSHDRQGSRPPAPASGRGLRQGRWRRRDPTIVRAMFWRGFRHALLGVRAVSIVIILGVVLTLIWQALAG